MTLRDKELEDRIEEVGNKLTNPPSDVQQLLLLLDKAENFLSRVEQCPTQSMHAALGSSMKALVTTDLLRHSDLDVKIAVASCLSEITRITAPDAPYDDDLMKEIFGLIVGAFKNLDEMSSRSFSKRVSILETVAKVRSCVLMLDLECDDLILDMFNHFLKTIRPKHSDTVFSSMETVMSLVIEESENVSAKLLSCLLDNLKVDEKNIMSSAKKLAEKVLANCALKLKPYLVEAFKGIRAPLSDYSKVVAAACQGNLATSMQNEMNTFGEAQADDSKLSDRTLCDELPQGSAKQEHEALLGKTIADADGSSKLVLSNGTFQMGNGDSMASEQKTEFSQSGVQLRDIDGSRLGDSDNLGSGDAKEDSGLNLPSRKGKKRKALVKLVVNNDHKQNDDEKEGPTTTSRRKGRNKEVELSQVDGLYSKEVETAASPKSGKKNKFETTPGLADVSSSVSLHASDKHDGIHSRKSRLPRTKKPSGKRNTTDKAAVDGSSSASGHVGLLESSEMTGGDLPTSELSSKKSEAISESERNLSKCSASKSQTCVEDSKTTPTANSETKHQRHRGRSGSQREVKEVDLSGQKQSAGTKKQKGGSLHVDEEDKEVKLKELVSSRKSTMKESTKDQSLLKDINESKSRRKHAGATPEVTVETPKRRKSNENLIGANIRVWWPEDERFYDGVVDSYDRSTKKHKILYTDGDVEILLLKKENWEFIETETKTGGENNTPPINASDVRNKKSKGRRGDATSDKTKTDLPLNSTPDATIKTESNDNTPKRKGRRPVKVLSVETPNKSSKGRGKSGNRHPNKSQKDNNQLSETANKLDEEKLAQSIKTDTSKSVDKVDNGKSKSGEKVGSDTLKIRQKSKGESSKSNVKSKIDGPTSRKRSRDAHDSGVKSKDEDSPARAKSSTEGRRKPGGRSAKSSSGSGKSGRGSAPRSGRKLNANDTPKSDQPKVEEAEARSTTGKKRKRGKLGR